MADAVLVAKRLGALTDAEMEIRAQRALEASRCVLLRRGCLTRAGAEYLGVWYRPDPQLSLWGSW